MLRRDISFKQALIHVRKEERHLKSTRISKWIRWVFFLFIGYTCVSTTLAWSSNFGLLQVKKAASEVKQDDSKSRSEEISAHTFAKTFAKEYLFWNAGNEDSRKQRLEPFLAPGLDEQAGFYFKDVQWNSWARMVEVWSVTEREGRLDILVYAETQMSNVKNPKEQKRVDRWMMVPIKKAGSSYVVVGTPYYVSPPEPEIKEEEEKKEEKGESVDSDTHDSITSFMESFWKVYTTGTPDEIQYFIKGDRQRGLTGILGYRETVKIVAYKEDKTYRVECDIRFLDLASGGEVIYPYTLHLKQEGERWYVSNIEREQ